MIEYSDGAELLPPISPLFHRLQSLLRDPEKQNSLINRCCEFNKMNTCGVIQESAPTRYPLCPINRGVDSRTTRKQGVNHICYLCIVALGAAYDHQEKHGDGNQEQSKVECCELSIQNRPVKHVGVNESMRSTLHTLREHP